MSQIFVASNQIFGLLGFHVELYNKSAYKILKTFTIINKFLKTKNHSLAKLGKTSMRSDILTKKMGVSLYSIYITRQ